MSDLASRIKAKMGISADKKAVKKIEPVEPVKEKKPHIQVKRRCCNTMKGAGPHEQTCYIVNPKLRKIKLCKHIGKFIPGGRWPTGTTFTKTWDGKNWHCVVTVEGKTFEETSDGSLKVEQMVTLQYLESIGITDFSSVEK